MPATSIGLAVGLVSEFERRLFEERRPYSFEDGQDALDAWALAMRDIAPHDAHDRIAARFVPLKDIEPHTDGPLSRQLGNILRPIGAKIAPHLSGEQAAAWRKAMVMALSDIPADVAIPAATEAIHQPMKFLSDVETAIRDAAQPRILRMNRAAGNFDVLRLGPPIKPLKRMPDKDKYTGP